MKVCAACGERPPKSDRATYCDDVSCERERVRDRVQKHRTGAEIVDFPTVPETDSAEAATRAALETAGRLNTPAGQAALALARKVDQPGRDTGSSQAAAAKQMLAALDVALRDAEVADDPVDELRRLRERRQADARGRRL